VKPAVAIALALVIGGLLAHLLLDDPGYVAVRAGHTLFETTLPAALLALFGFLLLMRSLLLAAGSRRRLAQLRAERRKRRAREDLQRGLLDLAAGNWKRSEELLTRAVGDADAPVVNYLVAARAADLQDAVQRREQWLARAQESAPEERAPALVTSAEMQMRRGQNDAAVTTLEQLDASGDINSRGLELLARLYQKLGRGDRLSELAPRLRNAKELPEQQVNELLAQAQLEELRIIGERGDRPALDQAWEALPRAVRRLPKAAVAYARGLMTSRDHAAAEKLLRETIDDSRDTAAIRLYGDVNLPDPLVALDRAESWLRGAPEDPDLLLTCARLCLRSELIGKARSYLEAGLARRPNPEASLLLADLLESIDEPARSSTVLREAVARSAGRRSPLVQRTRLKRY
jgi:HemY protein